MPQAQISGGAEPDKLAYDAQVRAAWASKRLSDSTRLNTGRVDQEQLFATTPTRTYAVAATRRGWRKCADGSEQRVTVTNLGAVAPNAGGHTHPIGKAGDILAELLGPDDGAMARATGKPAYVISRRRAFAVERTPAGIFSIRVVAGAAFSKRELKVLDEQTRLWARTRGVGDVTCQFIAD